MNVPNITLIAAAIAGLYACFYYLDAKHNFRFVDWVNSRCDNPFAKQNVGNARADTYTYDEVFDCDSLHCDASFHSKQSDTQKDSEIAALKERIAILEKIVTEPAYELNKKLNQL